MGQDCDLLAIRGDTRHPAGCRVGRWPISLVIDVVLGRGLGISCAARRLDWCCMGGDSQPILRAGRTHSDRARTSRDRYWAVRPHSASRLFRCGSPLPRRRIVARLLVGVDSCGFWFAGARTANCLGRPNTARGTAWIRSVRTACSLPIDSGGVVISRYFTPSIMSLLFSADRMWSTVKLRGRPGGLRLSATPSWSIASSIPNKGARLGKNASTFHDSTNSNARQKDRSHKKPRSSSRNLASRATTRWAGQAEWLEPFDSRCPLVPFLPLQAMLALARGRWSCSR